MKNKINLLIAIIISAIFLAVYNFSGFAYQCKEIRSNVIRLHIIANSDSEEDQDIKLKVRDALLEQGLDVFDGSITIENATKKLIPELDTIESVADRIIRINNKEYKASAELTYEYFDTRTYDNEITLPAGKYLALKVELGKAEGRNWWCVMFPALCLPAAANNTENKPADVFTNEENYIIHNKNRYEIRFKILEWIERKTTKVT